MIRGIHHVAIHTTNFDKMLAFYQEAFGFEPTFPQGEWKNSDTVDSVIGVKGSASRVVMLKAGTCFIELFEFSAPEPRPGQPLRPHDKGYTHFCIDVTDIEREFVRLKKLGMTFASDAPIHAGDHKMTYGKDFDGNIIELMEVMKPQDAFALESAIGRTPQTTRA